jgi:hypothetical protein
MVTDKVRQMADNLRGTCESLEDALNIEECAELDEMVFCCDICGWWYDTGELAKNCPEDSLICEKCGEDVEE